MLEELKVIIKAETDKFKSNLEEAEKQTKSFKEQVEEAGKNVDEHLKGAGEKISSGLKTACTALAATGTALLALGASTAEYRNEQAKLVTAFEAAGGSAETAKGTYNDLYRVLGDSGVATEAANHLAKLTTNQQDLSEWTNICQGIYATFGDSLPIEGLTEAANETAKTGELTGGLADALNWAGVSEDAFSESLAACNSESEREKLIRETLNGLYGDAAAKFEENNAAILAQNEAQAKLNEAMAALGAATAPIMTMLTELGATVLTAITPHIQSFAENYLPTIQKILGTISEALSNTLSFLLEHSTILGVIAAVIGTVVAAIGLYNAVLAVKTAMEAAQVTTIGALIAAYAAQTATVVAAYAAQAAAVMASIAPYVLIVAAIAAVIAIIVLCIKHWDEIVAVIKKAWDAIVEAVKAGVNWVLEWINKIINFVKENWQGLLLLLVNPIAGAFKLLYDNCDGFREFIDNFIEKVKEIIKAGFELVKQYIIEPVKNAIQTGIDKFNELKTNVTNKITEITSGIKNKFNEIKSTITNTVSNVFSVVSDKFGAIKEKISSAINGARDAVKNAIDAIKGFFNFKFTWPKIPMPKFSISPSGWKAGDLLKGSIPKLSIKWNALGGVFDKPTIFGYGSSLQGIGENGAEAVVPLEKNTQWLDKLATMLNDKIGSGSPIVLQVDGKTFAETSVTTINQLTKQRGSLPLVLV